MMLRIIRVLFLFLLSPNDLVQVDTRFVCKTRNTIVWLNLKQPVQNVEPVMIFIYESIFEISLKFNRT